MFPLICKIGPVNIYSYGLMLAVAVIVCSILMSRDAKSLGLKSDIIFDLIFWVTLGGILGARIFYILLNTSFFVQNPLEIIMIQRGGLAWQGGLIGGGLTGWIFIKQKKLSLVPMLDLAAPYVALGQTIGRLGCFLNGCCFGKPVSWGIYFPVHADHLHPTQLYCAVGLFIIFLILKNYRKSCKVPGQVCILYLILASTLRFGVEFFRDDHYTLFAGLSIYQWVSLGIFLIALYANTFLKSQHRA